MMSYLKPNREYPNCSNCRYATLYLPYYTFRFTDPSCSKGQGKCSVDKTCEFHLFVNRHYCFECHYFKDGFCNLHDKSVDKFNEACVKYEMPK